VSESQCRIRESRRLLQPAVCSLSRTRANLSEGLGARCLLGKKVIDQDLLDELETQLIDRPMSHQATAAILDELTARFKRKELADSRRVV